jgi:hypothetical protein
MMSEKWQWEQDHGLLIGEDFWRSESAKPEPSWESHRGVKVEASSREAAGIPDYWVWLV